MGTPAGLLNRLPRNMVLETMLGKPCCNTIPLQTIVDFAKCLTLVHVLTSLASIDVANPRTTLIQLTPEAVGLTSKKIKDVSISAVRWELPNA